MPIHIPEWLLWTLGLLVGVPAILFTIVGAWLGLVAAISLSREFWK